MKCHDDCHHYTLEGFEGPEGDQDIKFINKAPVDGDLGKLETVHDGTTNEEVLKMLIHRCKVLNDKLYSEATSRAIHKMKDALMWLESRTKDRIQRGVEGTHKK